MNIQASRMAASMASPAHAPSRLQAVAAAAPSKADSRDAATAVTISQAARDRLAASFQAADDTQLVRPVLAVGLAPASVDRAEGKAPVNPYSSTSREYKAAVDQAIDKLELQRSNQLISDTQFKHDMAFYTRVSIAVV